MKLKNNYLFHNSQTFFSSSYSKLLFYMIFFVSFYGGYLVSEYGYITGFMSLVSSPLYLNLAILTPILISTLMVYKHFDKSEYLILRLRNKKQYIIELIKNTLFTNFLFLMLIFLIIIISMNVFSKKGIDLEILEFNSILNVSYLLFLLTRLLCLVELISIFNVFLFKIVGAKLIVFANIVFNVSLIVLDYLPIEYINNIKSVPLFIGNYFAAGIYDNFLLETTASVGFIILFFILNVILSKIAIVKMRGIDI